MEGEGGSLDTQSGAVLEGPPTPDMDPLRLDADAYAAPPTSALLVAGEASQSAAFRFLDEAPLGVTKQQLCDDDKVHEKLAAFHSVGTSRSPRAITPH